MQKQEAKKEMKIFNQPMKYIYLLIILVYLPCLLMSTSNIGVAISLNGDIKAYFEAILKFQKGIILGDLNYALDFTSMGYGGGMFLFLAILVFPLRLILKGDQAVLIVIRCISLLALIGVLNGLNRIINLLKLKIDENIKCFLMLLISFLPATVLLVTRIHPEILQLYFFVMGTFYLLRFFLPKEEQSSKDFIFSILFYSFMVGFKISGAAYLIFPVIILTFSNKKIGSKMKFLLLFGVGTGVLSLVFLVPRILIAPIAAIAKFQNEFFHFSKILQERVISEFNYYEVLTGKKEVLLKWLTHSFSYGYFSPLLVMVMFGLMVYYAYYEFKKKNNFKIGFAGLMTFVINCAYYFLFSNRVATYYIYIPMILLIVCAGVVLQNSEN